MEAVLRWILVREGDSFKTFLRWLYLVSFALYGYFLIDGLPYYLTALQERPYHPQYEDLHPGGFRGQGFGVIGAAMMCFMLLYTLRKRSRRMRNWGKLKHWLDIHIYFGIMGPLFIILHASFKVHGLVAVGFWSMIAVALSGVVGRFLYRQIPRTDDGRQLQLRQLMAADERYSRQLQETLVLTPVELAWLDDFIEREARKNGGLMAWLWEAALEGVRRPLQLRRLRRLFKRELYLTEPHLHRVVHLAWRQIHLRRRMQRLDKIIRWFNYWHIFHKPFAIVLYVIMVIHIGVAIWLGYTWIF
ncbi:MAG: hypothetical protein D6681_11445 [Calditrichaeota bacterium]|nr:MAG: hypothetical protein D6681_11445 [Calditrichota bacterium]